MICLLNKYYQIRANLVFFSKFYSILFLKIIFLGIYRQAYEEHMRRSAAEVEEK